MPIYHDYHGDSKSSSISTWDQIQINLKFLLPTYQPILCDSPVVSSFLSDQKQPHICPEFQQSCDNINATLRKLIREEEENLYQESHAQIQQDLDPEVQPQIQPNKIRCEEIEKSDPEFAKSEYTETDSSIDNSMQESDQQIQAKSELKFRRINNYSTNEEEWNSAILQNLTEVNTDPEFSKSTKPKLNSKIQIRSQFRNRVDEDESDESNNYQGVFDWSVTVLVDRPPPEQPDLHLVTGSIAERRGRSLREEKVDSRVDGRQSHAGGRRSDKDERHREVGYDGTRSSAEVGASVREKWSLTTAASRTSSVSAKGGAKWRNGLARFCRISPIVAKPPPLLAAVFPWDREGACLEKAVRTAGCEGETETVEESIGFRVAGHNDSHSGLWSYDDCVLVVT
ncbi:hypothetical protein PIB30_033108 [Stylosanthes scabra]|uniref:Uncharacterized protein n=1 Tax=Stylosanthes scabra TaxID=79078 RepID=A0ABU6TEJ0_9FABA|nr:hypothetical protein [Stylosanthes scabra]